ncbi:MAG: glycoside hydrolase family 88 protein [Acholeplasmatales bacterium]|nr:glycoside hydrolase family 88 protein [Acholeplasmatales bacterium]
MSDIKELMKAYVDSLIENTPSYIPFWNQEDFKGKWNYIDGVFLNALVNLYYAVKDSEPEKSEEYKNFLIRYVNYYITKEGQFINKRNSDKPGYVQTELDSVCASKVLFDLYEFTKDERYLKAIETTYEGLQKQPRVEGGPNLCHKTSYPNQIWLDGMYMYGPFLARYSIMYNKPELLDEIKTQYQYIREHVYDNEKKLYYHCYDSTKSIFWANKETGCSPNFWLRSLGWYIVSLCDILEYYPEGDNKKYLNSLLQEALDGILKYQDSKTNMFYQIIDKPDLEILVPFSYLEALKNKAYQQDTVIKNYLETSGSSMISYSLLKASSLGYINSNYNEIGKNIFEGILEHSFNNNKLQNICITAGLGPENKPFRDGTAEYYLAEPVGSDDAKGVGPFLMAYIQYNYNPKFIIPTPIVKK